VEILAVRGIACNAGPWLRCVWSLTSHVATTCGGPGLFDVSLLIDDEIRHLPYRPATEIKLRSSVMGANFVSAFA